MEVNNRRDESQAHDALIAQFGKNTVVYASAAFVPAAISVLSTSIFTRLFNPSVYGQFALVVVTVSIVSLLLSSWLPQSTLRFRAHFVEKGWRDDFDRNLLILLGILTCSFLLLSILTYEVVRTSLGSYRRFYGVAIGVIVLRLWYSTLAAMLRADLRAVRHSQFSVAQAVLRFALAFGWVFLIAKDIVGLLWGMLLAQFILVVPMAYTLRLYRVPLHPARKAVRFRAFLWQLGSYGFPLIGWAVGALLLSMSDRYLLQVFRGSAEVGVYAPSYSLAAGAVGLVAAPLMVAAHPLLMKAAGRSDIDKQQLQTLIASFSRYFLLVAFPVAAFAAVFSREVAHVFLGAPFREAHVIIPIALFGLLAWSFAMYGQKGLEIRGRTRTMLSYVLICISANVLLNLYVIPRYGYLGAAVTTVFSFLLYPVLVYFGTRGGIAWHIPWGSMGKIGLAASFSAGCLYALRRTIALDSAIAVLMIGVVVLVPLYVGLLWGLKEIRSDEIRMVRRAIGKLRQRLQ